MAALEVVVRHELVQVALDFVDRDVEGLSALDPEALVQQRAVHALDETVGSRRGDLGVAVLDVLQRQQQLVGMTFGLAAELATVVGQYRFDGNPERVVERQHPLVQQIARRDRHLETVALGERQAAEGVDDHLDVDLAHALEGDVPFAVEPCQVTAPHS